MRITRFVQVVAISAAFVLAGAAVRAAGAADAIDLRPGLPRVSVDVPRLSESVAALKPNPGLWIEPANAFEWVFDTKADGQIVELKVKTPKPPAVEFTKLTVWDWDNTPVVHLRFAADIEEKLRFIVRQRGTYLLTLDGFKGAECVYRLVRSFSVTSPVKDGPARWESSRYALGICAFPGRYHWNSNGAATLPAGLSEEQARELEARAAARLGLALARLDVSMVLPEDEKSPIDWKRMDAAVKAWTGVNVGDSGEASPQPKLKLALQLMHPPDWSIDPKYANEEKDRWRFPRQEQPYRRYAREIVARYRKLAAFVQVNNEPDQIEFWAGPAEDYVTEVRWATDEIRKVFPVNAQGRANRGARDGGANLEERAAGLAAEAVRASPDAFGVSAKHNSRAATPNPQPPALNPDVLPIANGGYAFIDPKRSAYYVEQLKGKLDLAAYHSHGSLRELKRDMDHMRRLHNEAKIDRPRYWNTECGYAAWRLDQERTQAAAVVQKVLHSWAHGDEGMLLFCSRMTRSAAAGRSGRDFGFLDHDFCPRFVYGAVAAFSETFAGAKFVRVLSEGQNVHAYLFTKGETKLVAVFALSVPVEVTVASDGSAASVADGMGNAVKAEDAKRVTVKAGGLLQTVMIEGAKDVRIGERP